jgi:hypothetical protein
MPPANVDLGGVALTVEAKSSTNCALMQSMQVRCWGYNAGGQLGIGSTNDIGDQLGEMPPLSVPLYRDVFSGMSKSAPA